MNIVIANRNLEASKNLPIYLNTIGETFPQPPMERPYGSDFHQILVVQEGEGVLHCMGETYPLSPGCAFYTAPGTPYSHESYGPMLTSFVTVKGDAVSQLVGQFCQKSFLFQESVDVAGYLSDICTIIQEYYGFGRMGILSGMVYSFFCRFFDSAAQPLSLCHQIALYLEKNFTQKLSLEEIAAAFDISVSKLCHDFKKTFHYTVISYLLNLKLTYARSLLLSNRTTKLPEISLACGFEDLSYFCKAYKAKFGVTPTEDRKKAYR